MTRPIRLLLCWLLVLAGLAPAFAQTPIPRPAPAAGPPVAHPVLLPAPMTPGTLTGPAAGTGTLPPALAAQAQISSLQGQNTILASQVAALTAKLAAATPTAFGRPFVNTTGYTLVLHKQVSNRGYGQEFFSVVGSVAGYVKEINQARAAGADCWFLDYGSNDPAAGYPQSLANIYLAANQVNAANGWTPGHTGAVNALGVGKFSVYLGFDFSNAALEDTATLVGILAPCLKDPANLTVGGRPVYSCYTGGGGRSWASLLAIFGPAKAALQAQGVSPYFIWGGEPTSSDGSPGDGSLASLTAWCNGCVKPIADGVWRYAANPDAPLGLSSGIPGQERLAQAAQASGLSFQGSVFPGYAFGRNWVHVGPDGLRAQWRSVLDTQAPPLGASFLGVQVTSADDGPIGEQSNLLYGWDPAVFTPAQGADFAQPTDGKIASNGQYVQEMKTGRKPLFTSDTLIAWEPVQTGAAMAAPTGDPLGPLSGAVTKDGYVPVSQLPGMTDVECLLSASAQVRVTSAQQPAAAHTALQTAANNTVVYDLAQPFTGREVGQTVQITWGGGWTQGNYTVTSANVFTPPGQTQPTWYLVLDHAPGTNGLTGGQATLYPAGAALPPLPPAPVVTTAFAPAGQSFFQMPDQAGNVQTVELLRNGQTLLTLDCHAIAGPPVAYANCNYWTGTAHN